MAKPKDDAGKDYTDKKTEKLTKEITKVYSQAEKDIDQKIAEFTQKYQAKYNIHKKELEEGKITQSQFDSWVKGQVFQGKQWQAKKDQICDILYNANSVSMGIINGDAQNVFAANANYMSYEIEHGQGINFGFGVYDGNTVAKLIKDDPKLLPEWKIDEEKDYIWNQKKLNNALTQGIIQGENLNQIADRIATNLSMQNQNHALTFARTAMTGAQNAGRDQSLMNAKSKGLKMVKQWMATFDNRTRDTHAEIDGETITVLDKWHPTKFSNGCRYPGDPSGPPQEVYNCRCTLVGDVEDYPSEYERYDNIDGKPVKEMTYKDWYQAKYNKEFESKTSDVDYDKYGGKEVVDILSNYKDFNDLINHTTPENYDEFQKVVDALGGNNADIDKAIKEINSAGIKPEKPQAKKLTEEEKQQKAYEEAKKKLEDIEKEIKDKGADQTFEGIWYNKAITYADWEDKKESAQLKEEYFENKIQDYKKDFYTVVWDDPIVGEELYQELLKHDSKPNYNNLDETLQDFVDTLDLDKGEWNDAWTMFEDTKQKIESMQEKLDKLEEFQKHGEEYSKLLAEKDAQQELVKDLKPKPDMSQIFGPDAYTEDRKDDAIWAKSPKEADDALRDVCGEVWRSASETEKDAIYEYTVSYHKFNEPLRGIEYGSNEYKGVGNTDLNASYADNGKLLNAMTDIIDKSSYENDMWFQRGCRYSGMNKFFNCDMDLLRHGTQEELENALLGTTPTEYGFMSMGSSKGRGFSGDILLNVYTPAGTKMMYVEPFSGFGEGDGKRWDGKNTQSSYGTELETILQQGTQFRVTKVERSGGTLYFDLEVIDQSNQQRWKP